VFLNYITAKENINKTTRKEIKPRNTTKKKKEKKKINKIQIKL